MFQLLSTLVGLIAAATDVLPTCLKILESYLLLDAIAVMQVSISMVLASVSGQEMAAHACACVHVGLFG